MRQPQLVITHGQLWLPGPSQNTALAVMDGKVLGVGSNNEILDLAGPKTEVVDAGGAAVLPGFHDAHIHAQAGGLAMLGCNLDREHSLEGYQRLISEFAAAHVGEWVVGSGWFGDVFTGGFPDRALLDRLVPDRPAVFTSHDAHGIWVNTASLVAAGIDRGTANPQGGQIVRDENGDATGMLFETAGELVTRLIPPLKSEDLRSALLLAQEKLFSLGVTAWHDAILGQMLTLPDCLPAYLETIKDGSLRARVTGSIWWPAGGIRDRLNEVLGRVREARGRGFQVNSIKIMQDGICENCTAALIAPYSGVKPETRGDSMIDPEELAKIVTMLDAEGLSVHFHGVGDRAVRECLDAVAEARRRNGPGQHHQIAHLDVVDPKDFSRFAELDVFANLQPLWARADQEILERKLPQLGSERSRWHFPFESLREAGAHLAMGSDWPVTSPDPLWGLHTACTRTAPHADKHALNDESRVSMTPEERLDIQTAITAYTLGSAKASGNSETIGSLEPGKLADFVILTGPINQSEDLDGVRVARTYLDGKAVYIRTAD